LEQGNETDVEDAVRKAADILGPNGDFILSPVDNVRDDSKKTWDNIDVFLKTWKKIREYN
jgi:hypothetical protein